MKSQESYSPKTNQQGRQQYEEVIRPKAREVAMDMVMAGMARTILAVNDQSLLARAISTSASKNTHNIVRMVGGEIAYRLRKRLDAKENGSAERVIDASRLSRIGNLF